MLTNNDFGNLKKNETIEELNKSKRLLDRIHYFNIVDGKKFSFVTERWKQFC